MIIRDPETNTTVLSYEGMDLSAIIRPCFTDESADLPWRAEICIGKVQIFHQNFREQVSALNFASETLRKIELAILTMNRRPA